METIKVNNNFRLCNIVLSKIGICSFYVNYKPLARPRHPRREQSKVDQTNSFIENFFIF